MDALGVNVFSVRKDDMIINSNEITQDQNSFIKIDLQSIQKIQQQQQQLILSSSLSSSSSSSSTTKEMKFSFLFRYKSKAISIGLNNMEDEIVISMDQIVTMKIIDDNEIVIEFLPNFKKLFFHYPRVDDDDNNNNNNSNNNSAIQSTKDPANGKFNDANIIKFKPMPWVEKNTILMVEAGMQRLRFDLLGNHSVTDNSNIIIMNNNFNNNFNDNNNFNNDINNDNYYYFSNNVGKNVVAEKNISPIVYPSSQPHTINTINSINDDVTFTNGITETSEITEITTEITEIEATKKLFYITCVFLTERRATVFPREGSFIQFVKFIQKRFGLPQLQTSSPQQCHNLSYKNKVNDIISLKDEEDWNVAKWEIEMEGTIRLDVFVE
ncbi:hypothetical protein Glove_241g21 [Diversispora epigaea]|uniref:PB1 domain-containing protein n=1 Tax=Diversispora epigaea TaxID=1348612 RepID=A0A397ICR4_9GLOM|nr:hypothetical protein Glove_241g21 [Diversispora epigaea]